MKMQRWSGRIGGEIVLQGIELGDESIETPIRIRSSNVIIIQSTQFHSSPANIINNESL